MGLGFRVEGWTNFGVQPRPQITGPSAAAALSLQSSSQLSCSRCMSAAATLDCAFYLEPLVLRALSQTLWAFVHAAGLHILDRDAHSLANRSQSGQSALALLHEMMEQVGSLSLD